jgi:hypothetical protein
MLMQQGELNLERLIAAFNRDGSSVGWNLADIQSALRRADRVFYVLTIPVGIAATIALWYAFPSLSPIIAVQTSFNKFCGLVTVLIVGFVSGSGIWGILMVLSIVRGATRRATVMWQPFKSRQPEGVTELYSFIWSVAFIFSTGGTFLPALLIVRSRLPFAADIIVSTFVAFLFLGGLLLFSIPAYMLYQFARTQRDQTLDVLTPVIENSLSAVRALDKQNADEVLRIHYSLETALRLRAAILAESPAPVFSTLARGVTTLILPIFLTVIQILSSAGKQ